MQTDSTYWNWNQLAEYNKQIGKHNIGVMVSHEAQESKWQNTSAAGPDFLPTTFRILVQVSTGINGGGSGAWGMESYLGRISYNYDNRYIVTGTYRRDGRPILDPKNNGVNSLLYRLHGEFHRKNFSRFLL